MNINAFTKRWCSEYYDPAKEEFYIDQAESEIMTQWADLGKRHRRLAFFAAFITLIGEMDKVSYGLILSPMTAFIMIAIACWIYGLRYINANQQGTGVLFYVGYLISMMAMFDVIPDIVKLAIVVIGFPIMVKIFYRNLRIAKKLRKKIEREVEAEEKAEAEREKEEYRQWQRAYKAQKFNVPESNYDDTMDKAVAMFNGYTDDIKTLKKRYRTLAKEHHPDHGGDARMFQCIHDVYENYAKQMG